MLDFKEENAREPMRSFRPLRFTKASLNMIYLVQFPNEEEAEVRTTYPLRQVFHKPETSGRMLKWAVELGQFDIEYKPRSTLKGQALADFILEFPLVMEGDALALVKVGGHPLGEEEEPMIEQWWTLHVDGASNPKGSGAGIVLVSPEGHRLQSSIHFAFHATNNEAEYEAMIIGLKLAKEMNIENLL